ncbi:MAG: hypothetical protein MAG451_00024 [Anaerolineales bacterium]|nr:hypothetical protein [Anaerolineales bacterium]
MRLANLRKGPHYLNGMEPRQYEVKNGQVLLIREAAAEDARALLDYVEDVSGESDWARENDIEETVQ